MTIRIDGLPSPVRIMSFSHNDNGRSRHYDCLQKNMGNGECLWPRSYHFVQDNGVAGSVVSGGFCGCQLVFVGFGRW